MRSDAENCVYIRYENMVKLILIVWVDDLIIAGSTIEAVNEVKVNLTQKYKMKDFGVIKKFLGIEFEFFDQRIKFRQESYIKKIFTKF